MINFTDLCPNSTFSFIISDTQTLGQCFIDTCILIPVSLLFILVNVHTLSTSHNLSRQYKNHTIRAIRLLAFKLMSISLFQIFQKYFRENSATIFISDGTSLIYDLFQIISLILHFFNVMNKNVFAKYPIKLLIAFVYFQRFDLMVHLKITFHGLRVHFTVPGRRLNNVPLQHAFSFCPFYLHVPLSLILLI